MRILFIFLILMVIPVIGMANDSLIVKKTDTTVTEFFLHKSNYPNPFVASPNVIFGVPESSYVEIYMYDIFGEMVKTIFEDVVDVGKYEVVNDLIFDEGRNSKFGVYFLGMKAYHPELPKDSSNAELLFEDHKSCIIMK